MKPRYYHSLYINKKINERIKTTPPQQTHLNKKKKTTTKQFRYHRLEEKRKEKTHLKGTF